MLDIPDSSESIENKAKTDVRRELPSLNPFLKNSLVSAFVVSFANRIFDFYLQLNEAIVQNFPDTATGEFLERWGSIFKINRLPATTSTGNAVATGTPGSSIPDDTNYVTSSGLVFSSQGSEVIAANADSVLSITRSGTTATVTTDDPHNLSSLVTVTISGATDNLYNLTTAIQVTGLSTFTYVVSGSPATPATGTILANHDSVPVALLSDDFQDSANGIDVNLTLDTPLTLQVQLAGVDDTAGVDFGEIGGGTDQETDDALRIRLLQRIQDPVANFNSAAIETKAREINGVTRVWVRETTPDVGQVTIYFMRDNDDDPIPTAGERTTVKDNILTIKPANTIDADVLVPALTAVPTNFNFTSISPDTSTMETAISASLSQFFREQTEEGVNVLEDQYRTAIQNTVDLETGEALVSFVLSTPTGDITISSGEIGTLGTVVFV